MGMAYGICSPSSISKATGFLISAVFYITPQSWCCWRWFLKTATAELKRHLGSCNANPQDSPEIFLSRRRRPAPHFLTLCSSFLAVLLREEVSQLQEEVHLLRQMKEMLTKDLEETHGGKSTEILSATELKVQLAQKEQELARAKEALQGKTWTSLLYSVMT